MQNANLEIGSDKQSPFVFWRRIFAFLLDVLVLGIPGTALGFCFFDTFAQMGSYGRIIGFVAYLLYFGFFNSRLGHGQTVGKRFMRIKVVDKKGEFISPGLSLVRAAILALPISLSGIVLSENVLHQPFTCGLLSLLIFGFGGAWIYLFLFNKNSRQTFYDLVAGTVVVRSDLAAMPTPTPMELMPIWKGHLVILAVYVITFALVPTIMLSFELRDSGTQRRLDNAKALQRSNNLLYCQITPMTMQVADSKVISSSTNYLSVTGLTRHRLKNNSELFNRIAKELIKLNPNVLQMDGIQIRLTCCFDIGIACGSYGTTCNLSKSELMKLVNEK